MRPPEGIERDVEDRRSDPGGGRAACGTRDRPRLARRGSTCASASTTSVSGRRGRRCRRARSRRPKISRLSRRLHPRAQSARMRAIEQLRRAPAAKRLEVFLRLQHDAERLVDGVGVERLRGRARPARPPSRWSRTRRAPCRAPRFAAPAPSPSPAPRAAPSASGTRCANDRQFLLERRIVDPLIQAAPLQRVVHLARAVRREDDERRLGRRTVPSSGIVIWNSASSSRRKPSNSSSARSISSISRTAGRVRAGSMACSSGPLDEERFAVELAPRARAIERVRSRRGCAARAAAARSPTRRARG